MKLPGHSDPCRCAACTGGDVAEHSPLLSLCGLSFRRDDRLILDNVDFTVDYGDFIAITGPNGGGKTTLLRLILGLLKPSEGNIVFYTRDGKPTSTPPAFGYLPQKNAVDSHFPITVREVVWSGLLSEKGWSKEKKAEAVEDAILLLGLENLADRPIGRLSGGQFQRALLARAIVREPGVLVLDEPLSYLDKFFEERLYRIIEDISRRSTILLVSHEMSRIAGMACRHIIVDHTLSECTASCHFRPEI